MEQQLLEENESIADENEKVKALLSTSILENMAMRTIFSQLGYVEQSQVDILTLHDKVLSYSEENEKEKERWRQCKDYQELSRALLALRKRRMRDPSDHILYGWLPGEYIAVPVSWKEFSLSENQVWILNSSSSSSLSSLSEDEQHHRVVESVLYLGEGPTGARFGGIVAKTLTAATAAIAKAQELRGEELTRFYIDVMDGNKSAFEQFGSVRDYIVLHKFLAKDSGGGINK